MQDTEGFCIRPKNYTVGHLGPQDSSDGREELRHHETQPIPTTTPYIELTRTTQLISALQGIRSASELYGALPRSRDSCLCLTRQGNLSDAAAGASRVLSPPQKSSQRSPVPAFLSGAARTRWVSSGPLLLSGVARTRLMSSRYHSPGIRGARRHHRQLKRQTQAPRK